jgi:hypothetical protein
MLSKPTEKYEQEANICCRLLLGATELADGVCLLAKSCNAIGRPSLVLDE